MNTVVKPLSTVAIVQSIELLMRGDGRPAGILRSPAEVAELMICTKHILMVLCESVEFGDTAVDRELVRCINRLRWMLQELSVRVRLGALTGVAVVK